MKVCIVSDSHDRAEPLAQAWSLKNTQFKNVTGLTEAGHYSSARDVAVIAARPTDGAPAFTVRDPFPA